MTINEVLSRVRAIKPDALSDETKAEWLLRLEGRIFEEVIRPRLINDPDTPNEKQAMRWPEDGDQPLCVDPPFDRLYILYLVARIDYYYQDTANYNQSAQVFNEALDEWRKWYNALWPRHPGVWAGLF